MIVEIASAGRRLGIERGFPAGGRGPAAARRPGWRHPGDAGAHAVGRGTPTRLAELGVAVVVCDRAYRPIAWLSPLGTHSKVAGRLAVQVAASDEVKAELWRQIVAAKISLQAEVLDLVGRDRTPSVRLRSFASYIQPGDPKNLEARAARAYWPALFGSAFRRTPDGPPPNAALNYGYAVMRAAVARALAAQGLHPALGIHHANEGNPLCLADDLIEPFRPLVDLTVARLSQAMEVELSAEARIALAEILDAEIGGDGRRYGVRGAMQALTQSLARALGAQAPGPSPNPRPARAADGPRECPNPYRLMWMFVLYDLPVSSPAKQKAATKFREYLLDQGIYMVQYSIYKRFADRWSATTPSCGASNATCRSTAKCG